MLETYCDLKVDELLCPGTHLIVEAEAIFAHIIRREHKVTLFFLLALHDGAFLRSNDFIVHIEGATRLYLRKDIHVSILGQIFIL